MSEHDDTIEADDTEGHAKAGRIDEATADDTQGHGRRSPMGPAEPGDLVDDDTEGHAIQSGRIDDADDKDDTEGHVARAGR